MLLVNRFFCHEPFLSIGACRLKNYNDSLVRKIMTASTTQTSSNSERSDTKKGATTYTRKGSKTKKKVERRVKASHKHIQEQNPLLKLKSTAQDFDLCDGEGFRKDNRHWTFALSIIDHTSGTTNAMKKAPILRTVNFQRVSDKGIDFVMKNRGAASDVLFMKDQQLSFLFTVGKYLPGQTIQQWRSQGLCEPIRLKEIIDHVPPFTIVEMVASVRANKEGDSRADMDLSHFTELVQQTREDLDQGEVSMMELEEAIRAWRFVPDQIEQMIGGPDQIMWERNEWHRGEDGKGENDWVKPVRLMPF